MSNQTIFRQIPILTLLLIASLAGSVTRLNAASFIVTDLADAGPGTLRQAILDANATPGDDTISFTTNGTITLVTELPAITDNTTITGPGMNLLTVSGNNKVRIFYMLAGTTNSLSDLTVAAGFAQGEYLGPPVGTRYTNAPGVANHGTLMMQRCAVRDCLVSFASYGAGIFNQGVLDVEDCTISGSNMKPLWISDQTGGGGLFNRGIARMANCLITNCVGGWSGAESGGGGIFNATTGELFVSNHCCPV